MRLDIVSIFPEYLSPLRLSLVGKAIESGLVEVNVHDLRQWTHDRHRTVDDTPYGGGAGMVMKPEPWGEALDQLASQTAAFDIKPRLVVVTPSGRTFDQQLAYELVAEQQVIFACGRYEGIDARVVDHARERMRVDEISIGDYVLNGGEAAALVIIEAMVRLIPGVIGNPDSLNEESHAPGHDGLLEYPVYTKPPIWRDLEVPEVLFSGHHSKIAEWRREQSIEKTRSRRPDLLPPELVDIEITGATPQDVGELLTLQRAAFLSEAFLNTSLQLPPLTQTLDELKESLLDGTVLVARLRGRLVGSVRGELEGESVWYVGRLMVVPDLQGQGIGARLLTEIEDQAPDTCISYRMVTGTASAGILRFYARQGYRQQKVSEHQVGVPVVQLTKQRTSGDPVVPAL